MNVLRAFVRSLESELAGMTSSHRSFHTDRPTRRLDVVSAPMRRVEWRRIVAVESTVPSMPENVASQSSSPSSAAPTTYGSGSTWSMTLKPMVSRPVSVGARM